MKLSSLFDLYKSKKKADLADSSIALKQKAIDLFVDFLGDMPACKITEEMAEDFRLWLVTDERSKSSANFYLSNIKPVFGWLMAKRYISQNPFEGVQRYTTERKVRPIFTAEEVGRMLTVADARWKVIVLLAAEHSLRRGEVLNTCRDDIQGDWLHVQGKKKTRDTWPWRIKNHAETLLPVSARLNAALPALYEQVPASQPYLVVDPELYRKFMHLQAENSLSYGDRNCPYSNFTRAWRTLLERACVEPKPFKDLRGTYATALRRSGMQFDKVSKQMRHRNVDTTIQFYLRYDPPELAEESQKALEKFYGSYVP